MERSFDTCFGDVRIHEGDAAARMNAIAFTQGRDIHFAPGRYNPTSHAGRALLGHELTHVVQQRIGRVSAPQCKGAPINADRALEAEADALGARAARGERVHVSGAPAMGSDLGMSQTPSPAVIQRKVGFEFEIGSIKTYTKREHLQAPRARGHPRQPAQPIEEPLDKKDVIVRGDGFQVEADETNSGSDLEFVTDAFDQTAAGGERLKAALAGIQTIVDTLTGHPNQEFAADELGHGTGVANRFVRPGQFHLDGKPQATAGLTLAALDQLFDQVGQRDRENLAEWDDARVTFGGAGVGTEGALDPAVKTSGILAVAQARAMADYVIHETNKAVPAVDFTGPKLRALVTQLALYVAQGAIGVDGYAKTVSGGFLMRTDFATVFDLLPDAQADYLRNHPGVFVDMVCRAAHSAATKTRYQGDMAPTGEVFEGGLYNDTHMFGPPVPLSRRTKFTRRIKRKFGAQYYEVAHNPALRRRMPELTRQAWLTGITQGTDQLTAAHYPGDEEAIAEIESLGGYGYRTDVIGGENAPIVEFRGLKQLFANLFTTHAFDLFRYVHILNTRGFGRYPGQLLGLSTQDREDLISDMHGGQHEARQRLIAEAMREIKQWM